MHHHVEGVVPLIGCQVDGFDARIVFGREVGDQNIYLPGTLDERLASAFRF